MKKTILIATIILIFGNAFAQAKQAPENVVNAFAAKYPNAIAKKWEQNDSNYYVAFADNHKKSIAYYSLDGTWKKTETKITGLKNLPPVVKKSFKKGDFRSDYIANIKKIEMPSGIVYTIDVNDGSVLESNRHDAMSRNWRLYFNERGDMINHVELED